MNKKMRKGEKKYKGKEKGDKEAKKKPRSKASGLFMVLGDDLLSHLTAVPSARSGLTSLFGMGRGVPRRYNHRNLFSVHITLFRIDKSEKN